MQKQKLDVEMKKLDKQIFGMKAAGKQDKGAPNVKQDKGVFSSSLKPSERRVRLYIRVRASCRLPKNLGSFGKC